ncbi:MAG TPA: sigma-70 family RNA polymerase sigma factor, partial [Acidimicrobiales bacterium]|nr:sigma-70 family RNA polymerase sigma factor [Acidimicrobiales bacterium]
MNSVALPASASTNVLSVEADLVRQAARGDAESFGELFRRHSAPAWRLAQAVTADRDAAISAFRDGFARAVKAGRFSRKADTAFRPWVLASVYRSAIDQAYDRSAAPAPTRRAAGSPDAALADAAFRSLPERWRAAVWLSEVENLDSDRIAAVLGVSASVAEQLVARGRRGLAGRFGQAHHEMPEHVGEVLRAVALAVPANLADATSARWAASGTDHLPLLAPVTAW